MTAVDNIVAYVEGQGEAPIGPQPDFMAVMGSDSGFLSLVASPAISNIEDLAGHRWQFSETLRDVGPEEYGCQTVAPWQIRSGA